MFELQEKINKILDAHRRGFSTADIPSTVGLLEACYNRQPLDHRETFFQILQSIFYAEPLTPSQGCGSLEPNVHAVIIRAFAQFGPTALLPPLVFGLLRWNNHQQNELWVQKVYSELRYSLSTLSERFPKPVLDAIKAQCAIFTFSRRSDLVGHNFPDALVDAAVDLEKLVDEIEFGRFADTLRAAEPQRPAISDRLTAVLAELGFDAEIANAIKKARSYLESADPFEPKSAADLLRSAMEAAHRAIVRQIEKLTLRTFRGEDLDGARRAYLRDVGFITRPEEKFLSCIYSLISEEGTHKLIAPKETVLVLERTTNDFLLLLLGRLSRWTSCPDQIPQNS
jgi:hypothetical protein